MDRKTFNERDPRRKRRSSTSRNDHELNNQCYRANNSSLDVDYQFSNNGNIQPIYNPLIFYPYQNVYVNPQNNQSRDINIIDPRRQNLQFFCINCNTCSPLFFQVTANAAFPQNFERNEIDQSNENQNVGTNTQENVSNSVPKIKSRRMSISLENASKDPNIKNFLEELDEYRLKHQIEMYSGNKSGLKLLNLNSLSENFHFCDPVCKN